jgi:hypothetical protein
MLDFLLKSLTEKLSLKLINNLESLDNGKFKKISSDNICLKFMMNANNFKIIELKLILLKLKLIEYYKNS